MPRVRLLLVPVVLFVLTLLVAAKNPGPPADTRPKVDPLTLPLPASAAQAPWGEEVDGLSCRLLVEPAATHGQPIRAVVQIRNNSKRVRYIFNHFDLSMTDHHQLAIKGPDGKPVRQNSTSKGGSPVPASFVALQPGEIRRVEFVDIRNLFVSYQRRGKSFEPVDAFTRDGGYELHYTFKGPKLPKRAVVGQRSSIENGKQKIENIYAEATKEQLAGAWDGTLKSPAITLQMKPISPADLTVHEWGVFTVFAGAKQANLNRKEEWGSLPEDFYRQFPTRRLRWAPAAWDKPIIYLYSELPSLEVDVRVKFADGGAPVVWWPCAAEPVNDNGGRGGMVPAGQQQPVPFDTLRWRGWLGKTIPASNYHGNGQLVTVEEFKLSKEIWLQEARLPKASLFSTTGTTLQLSAPWMSTRPETERFIYYDGLVPAPDHLQCVRVTDDGVTVKNSAKFPIGPIFLIDRRPERVKRDAAWAVRQQPIPAGAEVTIPLQTFAGQAPDELVKSVKKSLEDAGLFGEEADSILKIWHKSFFEAGGLSALHLLPRAEYDRMLPLEVSPQPAKTVRVGIAYHPHIEQQPELKARVTKLIADLDSEEFTVREAATHTLEEIGPWVVPFIEQALRNGPSLETRKRLERILNKADAAAWLREIQQTPVKKLQPGK
ncbi:MAG: hypothetical protein AB7K24_24585 [Gemmataceae bacterium]